MVEDKHKVTIAIDDDDDDRTCEYVKDYRGRCRAIGGTGGRE